MILSDLDGMLIDLKSIESFNQISNLPKDEVTTRWMAFING